MRGVWSPYQRSGLISTMINIRTKGAVGENEVAKALNARLQQVLTKHEWSAEVILGCSKCIQRNQNQSAVGGSDLSNTFGLAIEIKRQEALSVNTWWTQCVVASARNKEFPVLIYRKNHQPWTVVMFASLALPRVNDDPMVMTTLGCRVSLDWDDFLNWFGLWVERKLMNGEYPRV